LFGQHKLPLLGGKKPMQLHDPYGKPKRFLFDDIAHYPLSIVNCPVNAWCKIDFLISSSAASYRL
jgi:hypothetical protein